MATQVEELTCFIGISTGTWKKRIRTSVTLLERSSRSRQPESAIRLKVRFRWKVPGLVFASRTVGSGHGDFLAGLLEEAQPLMRRAGQ